LGRPSKVCSQSGSEFVDNSRAIATQGIWQAIELNLASSALGGPADQLHDKLQQLLRAALGRLMKLCHDRLLFFLRLKGGQTPRLPPLAPNSASERGSGRIIATENSPRPSNGEMREMLWVDGPMPTAHR
jgi:hypothetical protein